MKENEFVTFCKCGCRNGIVLKADNETMICLYRL